jgi:hypothetical protein
MFPNLGKLIGKLGKFDYVAPASIAIAVGIIGFRRFGLRSI